MSSALRGGWMAVLQFLKWRMPCGFHLICSKHRRRKKSCYGLQTPARDKLLQIPFGAINNHGCNFSSSQVRGSILNELVQWVVRNSLTHLMHFSSLFYGIICQERVQQQRLPFNSFNSTWLHFNFLICYSMLHIYICMYVTVFL